MKRISIGGQELAIDDRGAGRPILFVHGFPLDHTMWEAQLAAFSAGGRVIAPDLPGFGESPLGPSSAPMSYYADCLRRLLDALAIHEPIVYCGLSMGGYIAWQFWRAFPDRLAGLVLCDTRAIADTPQAATGRADLSAKVLDEGPAALEAAMLSKLLGPETAAGNPRAVEATRQMIHRATPAGAVAALSGLATRPDVTDWLGEIRLPALLLCGEHDAISPVEEMRGIAQRMPDAEFKVIPAAGHMSPLENAAEFNGALSEFLDRRLATHYPNFPND